MGPIGQEYTKPKEYAHKIDLSYTNAALVALDSNEGRREAISKARLAHDTERPRNLKDILIEYLKRVVPILEYHSRHDQSMLASPLLDRALLEVFDDSTEKWLKARGISIIDLMEWTWILTSGNAERAASRLALLGHIAFRKHSRSRQRILPHFIYVFLLRRKDITAGALRLLLIYAWDLMSYSASWVDTTKTLTDTQRLQPMIKHPSDDLLGMPEYLFMIIVIRLLRRARQVWPAACESVTALLCRYLDGINFRKSQSAATEATAKQVASQMTFMYNTILKLLAVPASLHPFQSATHQQRAQFNVLRRMNEFKPALNVDRRGYRAVMQLQLMHKKTLKEREWANLKAKSWPPWKEDKLGIDADIGPEHGISRAKQALNRAKEAGYAADGWEEAVGILSGWDTDGSPTIQTRSIYERSSKPSTAEGQNAQLWAARIRATRTLNEAWAGFLAYEDQSSKRLPAVYHAMFEKLFYDAKRISMKSDSNHLKYENASPGDGMEVFAAPESPREAIYVRTSAPEIDDFFQRMIDDGVKPQGRLLTLLLKNAASVKIGIRYLRTSALSSRHVSALLEGGDIANSSEMLASLREIPDNLFAAYIEMLARFAPKSIRTRRTWDTDQDLTSKLCFQHIVSNPLDHSAYLMSRRRPRHRLPWYSMISAYARHNTLTYLSTREANQAEHDIMSWHKICGLLTRMGELGVDLDLAGFRILCVGLEKAIFACEERILRAESKKNLRSGDDLSIDFVLEKGLSLIKETFKDVVRSESMQQDVPTALLEEKSQMDSKSESEVMSDSTREDEDTDLTMDRKQFLPPACLLPRLLEVPRAPQLHSFIRVLGLRRDYDGILDLIEWMALYANEIGAVTDEASNGPTMMRRCLTATRVFLEQSWVYYEDSQTYEQISSDNGTEAAPKEVWQVVHDTILENQRWGGWPTDEEVEHYCANGRFV